MLYRSDGFHAISAATVRALRLRCGIRQVVDLRRPDEIAREPDPFASVPEIRYSQISMATAGEGKPGDAAGYFSMVEHGMRQMAEIVWALLREDGLPAVIHCVAGRDRTGVVIAVLLEAIGIDRQQVADDYALSKTCFARTADVGVPSDERTRTVKCRPGVILQLIDYLERTHGGAANYLMACGVSETELEDLQRRLTLRSMPIRPSTSVSGDTMSVAIGTIED